MNMEKLDLRQLNNKELHFIRKQVVRLKEKGMTGSQISELTGIRIDQVSKIWSRYQKEGAAGLKPGIHGRRKGEGMLLSEKEEREIRATIIDKRPDQVKLACCLWTRQAISEYIKRTYKKELSLRCITNYLKRWGMTCQRPTKRAYAQDDVRVNRFMKEEYPAIAKQAKEENAVIYWGDETGVDNQENYQRGFAPSGTPPILMFETRRERVNMISAITNQGSVRFMIFEEAMNQKKLIEFMGRLIRDIPRKVFLILDNLRVHHGKLVHKWLSEHAERIKVFFLPPYAPEYNPDEYLNHALKLDVHSGMNPRTKKDMIHKMHSFMRRLQHRKNRVAAFFKHPKLNYLSCYV